MSSAVESGSPATDQQKHTPADQVKEAATEFEAKRDPFHPEHISTNTAEAHEKPLLTSRATAATTSTFDGADDNASMIPLGKARAPETPVTEGDSARTGDSLTRSPSIRMTPSRSEIDSAKSAIIMAVAGCPVEREVSFSDDDNGTDTGRLEVRQILKGYKGIDEAIQEMNRDVKVKIVNNKPMSKEDAHRALNINQDGEGNLSFANSGFRSGAGTPMLQSVNSEGGKLGGQDNNLAAQEAATNLKPVDLPSSGKSDTGSREILSDKEALATGPAGDGKLAGTRSSAAESSDAKPSLGRLNTMQREELAQVPTPGAAVETNSSPLAAAALSTKSPGAPSSSDGRKSSFSNPSARKPVPALESNQGATSGHTRQTSAGTENLASKLRAEIDERARATKEARAGGASGATANDEPVPASGAIASRSADKPTSSATGGSSRLPTFDWEKEQQRSRAATPEPMGRETTSSGPTDATSTRGPVTSDSAAAAVAALPAIEKKELDHSKDNEAVATRPTESSHEASESKTPHPVVMTDTTPEPSSAVAADIPASPAGASSIAHPAASETTETSKPSAFTEEFDNASPVAEVDTTAEGMDKAVPENGTGVLGTTTQTKEAPKLSYANQPSNRRESKSGGFFSGLFRRKSRSGKPDASPSAAPRKSEEVERSTTTTPAIAITSGEPEPNKTTETDDAPVVGDKADPEPTTLSRVQTSGSNASAKNASAPVTKNDDLVLDIEKTAEDAVAGDNRVIESEVQQADTTDAEHPITAEGHKDASILEKLEHGPDEVIAEPAKADDAVSVKSRGGSVTAEGANEPSAIAVGTSYVEEDEPRVSENAAPVARLPTQKKKNRFSSFFSRSKKDNSPAAPAYQRETPQTYSSPTSPVTHTKDASTEADGVHGAGLSKQETRATTARSVESVEPEAEILDDRSITAIAASVPLPAPVYSDEVQAKRDRIRRKKEHAERVRLEKERQERELLAKRDRILNAYTGKQDFSKVPKAGRTKNFGMSIHTGAAQKEGADPVQHIAKADKKAYKAEEKLESNSRGSSLHEEEGTVPRAPPRIVDSSDDEAAVGTAPARDAEKTDPVIAQAPATHEAAVTAPAVESSGMERVPTDSTKAAAVLGGEPTATSPPKRRKSVKSSKTGTTTTGHRRKSSADAGLAPLSPVKKEETVPTETALPTSTSDKALPISPTKTGKDGQLKKRASTKSNKSHRREKSGDASALGEDHTLHLTGETASTGLTKRVSTKSNKTGRRKSVEPTVTSSGGVIGNTAA